MATTPRKDAGETGVVQDKPTAKAAAQGDHDRIVMASRRADGSMDQVDPEFIGDKETAIAAAEEQLAVQAASAVDTAARGVTSAPEGTGSSEPDAEVKALKDAQDKAVEDAKDKARAEVEQRHKGLGE
jgi:hypothetical protein